MSQANTGRRELGAGLDASSGSKATEVVGGELAPADARPVGDCRTRDRRAATRARRSASACRRSSGAVAGLLHGGRRGAVPTSRRRRASCACTGTSTAAGAAGAGRRAHRAAQRATGAVPAEGRRPPVPPRPLRRRGALPAGATLRARCAGALARRRGRAAGAPATARSPRSRSSWRPASGWRRTAAAARASASGAVRCSPTRSCAPTSRGIADRRATRCGGRPLRRGRAWRSTRPTASRRSRAGMSSDGAFLAAAAAIGRPHRRRRGLARRPLQLDRRVGRTRRCRGGSSTARSGRTSTTGTAGVGLFLAQLAAVTGDAAVRRDRARRAAPRGRARAGAAAAPARRLPRRLARDRVGGCARRRLLDEEELRARGSRVVAADAQPPSAARPLSGRRSRAAPGRSSRCSRSRTRSTTRRWSSSARAAGDELIGRATVTRHGWSWADPRRRYRASPVRALARRGGDRLGAARAVRRDGRRALPRRRAEGAFAYERSWLDADSGDLAGSAHRRPATRRGAAIPSPATGTWCHGEAGIALTRLRASAVLGPATYAREAELALETTRRRARPALQLHERDDLTLCHGAAGAADVLLCGERARRATAGGRGAGRGVDRALRDAGDWPCGAAGGTTPGLFRGLSGIGWWLLRLHDPAIPSPLALPVCG